MVGLVFIVLTTITFMSHTVADQQLIAGYAPSGDVTQHRAIDLDQQSINQFAGVYNFTAAYRWYSEGGNSVKTNSAIRTIKGFSSTAGGKLAGEKWFDIYKNYWNDATYADNFTTSACQGTGDFEASTTPLISDTSRAECCKKGALYQNIWMYVIHEMEAAIVDCNNGQVGLHWDEAVAFYTGSIPGSTGTPAGTLLFALSENRCETTATCLESTDDNVREYKSANNAKIFELFTQGRDYHLARDCSLLDTTKEKIVAQMTVPLLQSVARYVYFADLQEFEKERAELWAFAAALLPLIDHYSPSAASILRSNAYIKNSAVVPDGYANVMFELQQTYSQIGISCTDVGGLASSSYASGYYPGMEPCVEDSSSTTTTTTDSNDDSNSVPGWGIALIVILLFIALVGIALAAYFYCRTVHYHQKLIETHESTTLTKEGSTAV